MTQREQLGTLGWVESDCRRAANIVQAVHLRIQRLTVLAGEAKVQSGLAQLVDEMAEVRVVEIHVFVDIRKTEWTTAGGRRDWRF